MNEKYLQIMMAKGQQLWKDKHLAEARCHFEDLARLFPDESDVVYCLGSISLEQGDNFAAETHFRKLVDLRPDSTEARMLLGMTCAELGRHDLAVEYLQEVNRECSGVLEVHHRLGLSLVELKRYPEALKSYQAALKITPGHSGVLCSIGLLLSTMGRLAESQQYLAKALEAAPDNLSAMNNYGRVLKMRGNAVESLGWFKKVFEIDPGNGPAISNYLYSLNYSAGIPPERIAAEYRELAPRAFVANGEKLSLRCTDRLPDAPLRIGYVSGDLYGHSVAFFLEPILMHHDSSRFEIYCYSNRVAEDQTTKRLRGLASGWRQIFGVPDQQVAAMIADDRIDVLVDLSGHTAGHRLKVFDYRPARVQVSWIGHPNTTGLPQMDYYITDELCDPSGSADRLFTERLWRLPRVFSCYRPPVESPDVAPPPVIANDRITFGCFNNFAKVNETLVEWWSAILNGVPGSRLFIKNQATNDSATRSELLQTLCRHGIAPERIQFHGLTNTREEHFALYGEIDIALDTFPYHGTTTTCEALWMGVPVITLAGNAHVSRVGVSLLHAAGLDDLVASTPGRYVDLSIKLSADRQRLALLRRTLRQRLSDSPLMDAAGITRELEDAFRGMLDEKLRQEAENYFASGELDRAEAWYRHLLLDTPDDPSLHNALATVLDQRSRYEEALTHYDKALALLPDSLEIRCNIANTLFRAGSPALAAQKMKELLAVNPGYVRGWMVLGHHLRKEGRKKEAEDCFRRVAQLEPANHDCWRDLAELYEERREFVQALHCMQKALDYLPGDVNILNSIGLLHHELGDLESAESAYLKALSLDPGNAVLYNNRGNLCKSRLMYPEAVAWYDKGLQLDPGNASIMFNRSLAFLATGDFTEGWRGFEKRFEMTPPVVLPHRDLPEWNGSPLNGRRLLVQAEQVFGDTFMFARFVPLTARFGGPVVFECQNDSIRKALSGIENHVEKLTVRGEHMPPPDVQIPLLSLPKMFGITPDNIPAAEGYLTAATDRTAFWQTVITPWEGLNIGLVWGGRKSPLNADRSMPLQALEPLLRNKDLRCFSLQTGDDAGQAAEYPGMLTDLSPLLTDFGETAAAIIALDLVITIDTAVAHLAGALGKPVWVMLKYSPDWRWLLERRDSPWYASARLFRQISARDWSTPVTDIETAIKSVVAKKNN